MPSEGLGSRLQRQSSCYSNKSRPNPLLSGFVAVWP